MQKRLGILFSCQVLMAGCMHMPANDTEWTEYLGGPDRNHNSPLKQIDTSNVSELQVAWTYHTGDSGQVQCNPIIVDGLLYGVTASNFVFALDAATGRELWVSKASAGASGNVSRGVTYWESGEDKRILFSYGEWLAALDARTGALIDTFGDGGKVSLKAGLGPGAKGKFVASTTPGTLYGNLLVMPIRVGEEDGAAPGYIQAFNVRTGELEWVFHTIPRMNEPGYDTWPRDIERETGIGGANSWAGMAIDRDRGIIYAPTGSPAFDFYGGKRHGQNLYANCLLALNAKTGKLIWYYQFVHHDIWDRDLPAPPNLVTLRREGRKIDAVAQVTKSGHVFVFDRLTGEPLFPIEERPFPQSEVPGESAWPTQPIPLLPRPFARQTLTEQDISELADNRQELIATFRAAGKGTFRPLAVGKQTILFPGADGGAEWGGAAVDDRGVMYINANEMAWLFSLSENDGDGSPGLTKGNLLYNVHCASCHGRERSGHPESGYPSLVNLAEKFARPDLQKIITNGRGMMPGFTQLEALEKQAVIDFLLETEKAEVQEVADVAETTAGRSPYRFDGYNKFLDNRGYPAIAPPWGTLTAIDLNTGEQIWQRPLGEFQELSAERHPPTGTENYGGPVVTAGGVLFIAATKDGMFRAFDAATGKLLWEDKLPAPGFATPSTYEVGGKQYVVVAAFGTKLGTAKGDTYVAYVLGTAPRN